MPTIDEQAHDNLCEFVRFQARLLDAEVLDEPGVLAYRGAIDYPSTRLAIRTGPECSAAAFADAVTDFLFRDGRTAAVYLRDTDVDVAEELTARDFVEYSRSPEMVCEARLDDRLPPDGVTVRLAASAADVHAYAEIAAHAFRHLALTEEITRDTVDRPDIMLEPGVAIALAEIDGRPVAGACSILMGAARAGYVGWVACLDDARGNGLGDVVTRRVTNESFDRGAPVVTLEASPFGESTYARMGYREIYRYATLVRI